MTSSLETPVMIRVLIFAVTLGGMTFSASLPWSIVCAKVVEMSEFVKGIFLKTNLRSGLKISRFTRTILMGNFICGASNLNVCLVAGVHLLGMGCLSSLINALPRSAAAEGFDGFDACPPDFSTVSVILRLPFSHVAIRPKSLSTPIILPSIMVPPSSIMYSNLTFCCLNHAQICAAPSSVQASSS